MTTEPHGRSLLAFVYAVPIAILGGLIGLGGAEFRLPVLVGPLRYAARRAVPINLAISMVTICASLAIRSRSLSFEPVEPFVPAMAGLIAGAVTTALVGTALLPRLSDERLERIILWLLVVIGCALIVESFLPTDVGGLLPESDWLWVVAGFVCGLGIGLVSSLLGVAGGEVIIPTMVFVFGAGIKTAGTASLLVSLPTVAVGIMRYARQGSYDRQAVRETIAPMGAGSIVGAVIGGLLVGIVPSAVLKFGLGCILIASAVRIFRSTRSGH